MLDFITGLIGTILYPLFSIVFIIIDTLQAIFMGLAGIGTIRYGESMFSYDVITGANDGGKTSTGLIYFLLQTPLVRNMLMSIMLLAIFLLIIFTVFAFLKNAYSPKPKGWKEIIGLALKGLGNFVFIPVLCLLGVWMSNILLNAINGATSTGGATLMSRKLFLCAAYNANYYRIGTETGKWMLDNVYGYALIGSETEEDMPFLRSEIVDDLTQEQYANMLDQIYASGYMDIYTHTGAAWGYSLFQINYLTLIIGGVFMCYALVTLTYGMVKRMFYLLTLYIISPAICSMYPMDEGNAVKQWKGEFVKNTISAYGPVAGLNIFFSLLPLVNNLQFATAGYGFWGFLMNLIMNVFPINTLIQLIIMVCGLFVVKELIGTISGMIGAADAYAQGQSLRQSKKAIKDNLKKATQKTSAFVGNAAYYGRKGIHAMSSNRDRKAYNKANPNSKKSMLQWAYDTDQDTKKGAHDSRVNEGLKKKREAREEKLAKKFKVHDDDVSWRKADEETRERRRRAVRFNDRGDDARYVLRNEDKYEKKYKEMTEEEKLKVHTDRMKEENKTKGFGSETIKGKVVRSLGKSGLSLLDKVAHEEVDEAKNTFKSKYSDRIEKEEKKEKKGAYGEKESSKDIKEIIEALEKLEKTRGEGVVLKGVTNEVLSAMGNNLFKDKVFGAAKKGKIDGFDFESVGLNARTATMDDVSSVDSIINSVASSMNALNKADPKDMVAMASVLYDKLASIDTRGNDKLEEAIANAMGKLSQLKGMKVDANFDPASAKNLAKSIGQEFSTIADASNKNAKAIQKYIESAAKEIVKAIKEDERKNKK